VDVKDSTVYFQLRNVNAAVVVAKTKMFGCTKPEVKINVECAVWNM
jgi:hypothetical protein